MSYGILVVFWCVLAVGVGGHKILGIFPSSSRSHYIIGSALMRGLAARGHEVSVITAFPTGEQTDNFEEIPIPEVLKHFEGLHESLQRAGEKFLIQTMNEMVPVGRILSEKVLEQSIIQNLLHNPNRTFDLVICEIFVNDALFGFGQHFSAPVIGISPLENSIWTSALTGSPMPPAIIPNIFLGNANPMSFLQRLTNHAAYAIQYFGYHFIWIPYQTEVYNKFFPDAKITLPQVLKNVSLVLLNQQVSIGNPQPLLNNMIEVAGLHIQREVKPLPPDIQEFLDGAVHGAIYFSLGTNWKSKCMPKDKLQGILNVFRSIKQRVLWKYENSSLPGKTDNVLISDWMPQNDILAHPKVNLFITHGGALGTTEAIFHGKPFIGIPAFCDQFLNMARAIERGYALKIPYTQLTEHTLKAAINEVLSNPKYSQRARETSARYRDQPLDPLQMAIYWVEYVLRHKGAPHLRSVALDLNLIQYYSIDTTMALLAGLLFTVYLVGRLLKRCITTVKHHIKPKKE